MMRQMKILVVTRSYPSDSDLYQYPFVHRRVLAYRALGHDVSVFRPSAHSSPQAHDFEGVTCTSGDRDVLAEFAKDWRPDVIAAHGFNEVQWEAIKPLAGEFPVCAWLHGSEIPEFARRKAMWDLEDDALNAALEQVDARCRFWNEFLRNIPPRFQLVFVSEAAVDMARTDLGPDFSPAVIIPNLIDTELFSAQQKTAVDRTNILMIRPFDSRGYGNDLAVQAILELSNSEAFETLQFTIVGNGPMFDETLAPVRHFSNVRIHKGFVRQEQIPELHRTHGIFLVPTRIDTQGVSRDEAMASGLVPVTNAIPAIKEYLDEECGVLGAVEDFPSLAKGILEMVADPQLFERRSAAAAARIRRQSGSDIIVPRELALLESAAHA